MRILVASLALLLAPLSWAAGLQAPEGVKQAQQITKGSRNIVVAVVDTGIDPLHEALRKHLWKSPQTGSVYGWDFVRNEPNPIDSHGHGTHIAGIIVSIADVQIMPVKFYRESAPGSVNLKNTIKALKYAVDNNANIINYSGGGPEYSEDEYQVLKEAERKGILVVVAAGNDGNNTDLTDNRYYPAAYKLKGLTNIITVASLDSSDKLLRSSNWGIQTVDIGAPGEGIMSSIPGDRYGKMTGTSQATAFVTGVAALMLSKSPRLTPTQIKTLILANASKTLGLMGRVATSGKLNAYRSVASVK